MATVLTAVGVGAVTASYISAAASAISVAMAIATPIMQASQQAKVKKANAAALDEQARQRAVAGQMAAEKDRRRNRQILAEQSATAAGAGVLSGTSLDLLDQNSVALEMNALTVAHNAEVGATRDRNAAANLRADAKRTMSGGYLSAFGGGMSALSGKAGKGIAGAFSGGGTSAPRVGTLLDPLNY